MKRFVLGEVGSPDKALQAARLLRAKGIGGVDIHSPFPIHGSDEALGLGRSPIAWFALAGGAVGAVVGYATQWWTAAVSFPLNVGNRPPHAPPSFIPITFELMVLFASLAIFGGLLWLWRLPRPYHPLFDCEQFRGASGTGFWLSVELQDSEEGAEVRALLEGAGASLVSIVEERA